MPGYLDQKQHLLAGLKIFNTHYDHFDNQGIKQQNQNDLLILFSTNPHHFPYHFLIYSIQYQKNFNFRALGKKKHLTGRQSRLTNPLYRIKIYKEFKEATWFRMDKFTNFDFSISFIKWYISLNNLLESRIQQNSNLLNLS